MGSPKTAPTRAEVRRFLADLIIVDNRALPDNWRKAQFKVGWRKGQAYARETLKSLTWNNLGYRLGEEFGRQSAKTIEEIYRQCAADYRRNHPSKERGRRNN